VSTYLGEPEFSRSVLVITADGSVRASVVAKSLLGLPLAQRDDLDRRFAVVGAEGSVLLPDQVPWRRLEPSLLEPQRWYDRETGRTTSLRVNTLPIGDTLFVELEAEPPVGRDRDPEARVNSFLAVLNQSLRADGPDRLRGALELIVELACELTDAQYGALGVLASDGRTLRDFIQVGFTPEQAARIGHLPAGKGLLGALVHEGRTIRLRRASDDPRSEGVPADHPAITSFLGTPIRVGDVVFGNFYLANKRTAPEFTEQDEHRLERFSAQAAMTIALARRADEGQARLFETLVEHAPYGMVHCPVGRSEGAFSNAAAQRVLGCSRAPLDPFSECELTLPNGSSLPPESHPWFLARQGETVVNAELRVVRPGQPARTVLVSAAPVRSDGLPISGVLIVCQEMSMVEDLERLRREFAAVAAHDMRTPLQAILVQVEALLRRAQGEAAWVPVRALETVRRSSVRLSRLMSDLLDASRLESDQLLLDRQLIDLASLAESVVEQTRLVAPARHIVLESEPVPPVSADPVRIEQIVTNLVDNAVKYSPESSTIRVTVRRDGAGVRIGVVDQGPGIAPSELPRLFDRYYRVRGAHPPRPGLGLGLYIARGLATAHGGTLGASSQEGEGSEFSLWLPGAEGDRA
jgi:signal transduction histidine kinase